MDILVVGAGVVGLAIARALAMRGHAVVVAEREGGIGTGISSRNSEVVHGGMYYPSGSLRARHCVRGRAMLHALCEARGIAHRRCGKLIVATNEAERAKVAAIHVQGRANGVAGLAMLDGGEARSLEPALNCVAALHSPHTGIVDSHGVMLALQGDIEDRGGTVAYLTPVETMQLHGTCWRVRFGGSEPGAIIVDAVVNAAGLGAQALARGVAGYDTDRVPPLVLAKGNYFGCQGRAAFSRLIYPAPVDGGLGIHVTLDLQGRMRFGPDVEWIDKEDYTVDAGRAAAFYSRIRTYWPGLSDGALVPDYCGIRPKLTGPGQAAADFLIDGPAEHGLPGLIHLFGIESPGLTASLSLAEEVADRLAM